MSGVELSAVSKSYGETLVIDDLSLAVEEGEFVVFLGPSGCGKSTLLRMIAGLEELDSGAIMIDGNRVDTLPPGKRDVAMVFQHYALYPHMTIRENLAFGLKNAKIAGDEIDRRIEAAARSLEIGEFLERRPGQMSGGQKQRAAIARAIVKHPRLFLFDEPLSNLDAALRARTRIELAQLHQQLRTTMIFVTHDQIEAMTLADRIVVINRHRIEQIGAPMEIYCRPATQFVASFVGTPRINLLPAVASDSGGKVRAQLPDGTVIDTAVPWESVLAQEGVTMGLRPESVRIAPAGTGNAKAQARVVERLGERTLVYVALADGTLLTAEDRGDSAVHPGDSVELAIDGAAAHLFSADGTGYHAAQA